MSGRRMVLVLLLMALGFQAPQLAPQALASHVAGTATYAYVANSGDGTISIYTVHGHVLRHRGYIAVGGAPRAVVATFQFVFVAESVSNKILVYTIDRRSGALRQTGSAPVVGVYPGGMALALGGRALLVTSSAGLSSYSLDPLSGTLSLVSTAVAGAGAGEIVPVLSPGGRTFVYVGASSAGGIYGYELRGTKALTPVGSWSTTAPASLRAHPSGRFLYVANGIGNSISVFAIDAASGSLTLVERMPAGSTTLSVTVDPSGSFLYAANYESGTVSAYRIDPAPGRLTSLSAYRIGRMRTPGRPIALTFDLTGHFLFVLDYQANELTGYPIDAITGVRLPISHTISTRTRPTRIALAEGPVFAYRPTDVFVVNNRGGNVATFAHGWRSDSSGTLAEALVSEGTTPAGLAPSSIAVDPFGRFVYVTNAGSNSVWAYRIVGSTESRTHLISIGPVATGERPTSIAIEPSGRFVYVANVRSYTVSIYAVAPDSGMLRPLGSISTRWIDPVAVTVDPSGRFAYLVHSGGADRVSSYAINPDTGMLTDLGSLARTGSHPTIAVVDPAGLFLYVLNMGSDDISVFTIDGNTGALSPVAGSPFPAGSDPLSLVIEPTLGERVYVGSYSSGLVSGYRVLRGSGALEPMPGPAVSVFGGVVSLAIAPNGRYVYATSAIHTLTALEIDRSGALTRALLTPVLAGASPRSMAVLFAP